MYYEVSPASALNSHSARQKGQVDRLLSHVLTHCRWKACPHFPHTHGQSSPGYFMPGLQPSKLDWQIPQTSSPAFQLHRATPCHLFILTRSLLPLVGMVDFLSLTFPRREEWPSVLPGVVVFSIIFVSLCLFLDDMIFSTEESIRSSIIHNTIKSKIYASLSTSFDATFFI